MSTVKATAKNLRVSARKLGLVAGLVRGRSTSDSMVILQHTPKAAATILAKVVKSAQANAENNRKLASSTLVVDRVLVSNAGLIKRFRAGSRGMVRPLRHRLANVTVVLEESKPSQPTATKPKKVSKVKAVPARKAK